MGIAWRSKRCLRSRDLRGERIAVDMPPALCRAAAGDNDSAWAAELVAFPVSALTHPRRNHGVRFSWRPLFYDRLADAWPDLSHGILGAGARPGHAKSTMQQA
jgi:hypothetical protein